MKESNLEFPTCISFALRAKAGFESGDPKLHFNTLVLNDKFFFFFAKQYKINLSQY